MHAFKLSTRAKNILAGLSLMLAAAPLSWAQATITPVGLNGDSAVFTVSGSDLLQTNLSSSTLNGTLAIFSGGLAQLTDGDFGPAGGSADGAYDASVGFSPGSELTYNFDLGQSATGYSLTSIATYSSWDAGRDGQEYTVSYALVSAPTDFITLVAIPQYGAPEGSYNDPHSVSIALTNLGGGASLDGVAALRFTFTGYENDGTAFREIDVMGTATASAIPEPSTYAAMAGALALGVTVWRRKQKISAA